MKTRLAQLENVERKKLRRDCMGAEAELSQVVCEMFTPEQRRALDVLLLISDSEAHTLPEAARKELYETRLLRMPNARYRDLIEGLRWATAKLRELQSGQSTERLEGGQQ